MSKNKIKDYLGEEWKDLVFENMSERSKYKISNYGRIISYYYNPEGVLLKLGFVNGYRAFTFTDKNGKKVYNYAHRLVAKYFIDKPREDQYFVIHKDINRHNNNHINLMWANEKEKFYFHLRYGNGGFKNQKYRAWSKLTESQVKIIKKKLADPNRKTKMKVLARQFGVSEMQISRIKSGENWGTVSAD